MSVQATPSGETPATPPDDPSATPSGDTQTADPLLSSSSSSDDDVCTSALPWPYHHRSNTKLGTCYSNLAVAVRNHDAADMSQAVRVVIILRASLGIIKAGDNAECDLLAEMQCMFAEGVDPEPVFKKIGVHLDSTDSDWVEQYKVNGTAIACEEATAFTAADFVLASNLLRTCPDVMEYIWRTSAQSEDRGKWEAVTATVSARRMKRVGEGKYVSCNTMLTFIQHYVIHMCHVSTMLASC